ncbi:MAG TPA: hypothetical protein VE944_18010 [Nostoc sp.]|nr:hypothetical protein [Nostoc sp.]HYX16223.1 hypothetical protein [Nostoc sp.]
MASPLLYETLREGRRLSTTSRLRRETRLQRWTHRNALASLRLCGFILP